jgi:transaldolase
MKATQKLHELGQNVWLDNITRDLLTNGTLKRNITDLSPTRLTSNPTSFDHAIEGVESFVKSWNELLGVTYPKTEVLKKAS